MKFWFSKKKNSSEYIDNKKKNNDEIYKAILKNREAIDALEKKQVQVEKKIKVNLEKTLKNVYICNSHSIMYAFLQKSYIHNRLVKTHTHIYMRDTIYVEA
ncbi:hypothetical protein [Plasmodium yoelii yoelii]|uniref:Uncharacterized protein n=1 Tax=Plasmodium yoelii yoelii TaxID=73239 RepID=Q7RQ29_PLAYO|nr:hypothetical protein [Plasmodium yoelii yoelii]